MCEIINTIWVLFLHIIDRIDSIHTTQIQITIPSEPVVESHLIESHGVEATLYKTQLTVAAASVFLRILIAGIVETRGKSRVAKQRGKVSVSAEAARVEKGWLGIRRVGVEHVGLCWKDAGPCL